MPSHPDQTQTADTLSPRSAEKRARILKVAGKLFMEHGYAAVSMDSIAEAAPVSKPTLYRYFENKASLFFAVIQTRSDLLFQTLESDIRTDRPVAETLHQIAHRFLDVVANPEAIRMYRIIVAESAHFQELGASFYENGPRRISKLISDYLRSQHKAGTLHVPDPDLSANFFISMIKGNAHMQCVMGMRDGIPMTERKKIISYAVDSFLNGHLPSRKTR